MYCRKCDRYYAHELELCPQCGDILIEKEMHDLNIEFIEVATVNSHLEANLIKGLLEANEIELQLKGEAVGEIYALSFFSVAGILVSI